MKIVIDTNVLISAFLFPGISAEVFDFAVRNYDVFVSEVILDEFSRKCIQKFKIEAAMCEAMIAKLRRSVAVANPVGSKPSLCRDPDDDEILWLAASVSADILLTGDDDLLVLREFEKISVLNPRQFKTRFMTN